MHGREDSNPHHLVLETSIFANWTTTAWVGPARCLIPSRTLARDLGRSACTTGHMSILSVHPVSVSRFRAGRSSPRLGAGQPPEPVLRGWNEGGSPRHGEHALIAVAGKKLLDGSTGTIPRCVVDAVVGGIERLVYGADQVVGDDGPILQ